MNVENSQFVTSDFEFNGFAEVGHAEVSVFSGNLLVEVEWLREENERITEDFKLKESKLKEENKLVSCEN